MTALGLVIRDVTLEDREGVVALLNAAFEREGEAGLVQDLWKENAVKYERLAENSGVIVGYCAFSAITCQPPLDGLLLGLGPVAVAPSHRRQGVSSALVREGLRVFRDNDARLIAVLGDPVFYCRFGFEPASVKKISLTGFNTSNAFQILNNKSSQWGDINTDESRTIHYHPAFDAFA